MANKKYEFGFGTKTILAKFMNMRISDHKEEPAVSMPGRPPASDKHAVSLFVALTNFTLSNIAEKFNRNIKLVSRWNREIAFINLCLKHQNDFVEYLIYSLKHILTHPGAGGLIFDSQEEWLKVRKRDPDFLKDAEPLILDSIKDFADSHLYKDKIFELFLEKIFGDDPMFHINRTDWIALTKIMSKVFYGRINVKREFFKRLARAEFDKIEKIKKMPKRNEWNEIKTNIILLDELLDEI